jgi:hypothetical protein
MWAIFILLWYSGARKSDAMPTNNTPFSKRRMHRASVTFHSPGADLPQSWRPPTVDELTPHAGMHARVRMAASKTDQTGTIHAAIDSLLIDSDSPSPANGAQAMREYLLACPPIQGVPLRDQPLFSVPNENPIEGALIDEVFHGLMLATVGDDAGLFSVHSMRIGAATTLRDAGYDDTEICRALRWASVPCMQNYARVSRDEREGIAQALRSARTSPAASRPAAPANALVVASPAAPAQARMQTRAANARRRQGSALHM